MSNTNKYQKIDSIKFKRKYPRLYRKILSDYAPVFDRWVAIAMWMAGDAPPCCEVCGNRVQVSFRNVKNSIRCRQHAKYDAKFYYTYDRFMQELEVKNTLLTYPKWEGEINASSIITVICSEHGKYQQVLKNSLVMNCQKCYTSSESLNKLKYDTQTWIKLAKQVHHKRYDYSKSVYAGAENKMVIKCPIHGEFEQQANLHLKGHGCRKCAHEESSQRLKKIHHTDFVSMAEVVHGGKYSYDLVDFKGFRPEHGKITITCPKHGNFKQRPGDHLYNKNGCPKCGFEVISSNCRSQGEINLENYIKNLGVQVIPSYRELGFEIDLYLPEYNTGIEYNGLYWHGEVSNGRGKYYHYDKWKTCRYKGIHLYTVYENDYHNNPEIIHNKIKYICRKVDSTIGARKCTLGDVPIKQEFDFLDQHHIQGHLKSRKGSVGAYHCDELVAVLNWCYRPKYLEITRYCCDNKASYPGLFSRLMKHMISVTGYKGDIVSFSNNDDSNGGVYSASGFKLDKILGPAYWYTQYKSRENRQSFMKSKISKKFNIDMTDKTEWQAMQELGWDRIWDTGKIKWIKTI